MKTTKATHRTRVLFGSLFALLILVFSLSATSVLAASAHGISPPHAVVHATKGPAGGLTFPTNQQMTSFTLDGVTIKVQSPFPSNPAFVASKAGDAIQGAISVSDHPYREFSVVAVPFGTHPGSEAVPVAQAGGAQAYRLALHASRLKQGGNPRAGPTATLFGQQVSSEVSLIKLHLDSAILKPTLIVEWVVQAGQRLWIVRISQEQTHTGIVSLNSLRSVTLSSTTLGQPSTLLQAKESHVQAPGVTRKPHPFDLSNPSWWNGTTCDTASYSGSYQLGTVSYQGLIACGPRPVYDYPYTDVATVHFFPGAWGVLEWECVEISMRYLYLAYGVAPYSADGYDVVWNYSGSVLQKISNGSVNQAPQAGDVLSYGTSQNFGHTSVVSASNVDGNGNGSISVMEENASSNGADSIAVSNWTVQPTYGMNITGWLHKPGQQNQPPIGHVDSVDGVTATGWAFDPDVSSTSIDTQMTIDGNQYDMGPTPVYRSDVNAQYGITGNHGFAWPIPFQYGDGYQHSWQIYAVDPDNGNTQTLIGSGSFQSPQGFSTSVAMSAHGTTNVAALGANNSLDFYRAVNGQWQAVVQLAGAGTTYSAPSLVAYKNGNLGLAVEGPSHSLYFYWTANNQWYGPLGVGAVGSTYSTPSVAVTTKGDTEIAVQSDSNTLHVYWTSNGQWVGPYGLGAVGSTYSAPSMVALPKGNLEIAVQSDSHTLHIYWTSNGQWVGPYGLGAVGSTYSAPSMVALPKGNLEIAVQSDSHTLHVYWTSNGQWVGPYGLGAVGSTYAIPSMAATPKGGLEIAVQSESHTLHVYWTANNQWYGPYGLGAVGSTYSSPY